MNDDNWEACYNLIHVFGFSPKNILHFDHFPALSSHQIHLGFDSISCSIMGASLQKNDHSSSNKTVLQRIGPSQIISMFCKICARILEFLLLLFPVWFDLLHHEHSIALPLGVAKSCMWWLTMSKISASTKLRRFFASVHSPLSPI